MIVCRCSTGLLYGKAKRKMNVVEKENYPIVVIVALA